MAKIKLTADDEEKRGQIESQTFSVSRQGLSLWAQQIVKHVMMSLGVAVNTQESVKRGFDVLDAWRKGAATVKEVRAAALAVHRDAKACKTNPVLQAALRCAGHAVATGHTPKHAIIASDYAILALNLLYPGNTAIVRAERTFQFDFLSAQK